MKRTNAAALAALVVVCLCASTNVSQAQSVPSPWSSRDIGSPALNGSAASSNGVFTIDAAGEDIWGTSDQFHFVYQAVSGDVDVRARVDSITDAHAWSKAGVMIRGSLSAGSAHGMALVSAARGTAFQRRPSNGGISTNTAGPWDTAPRWVRLVRSGTTVTAYTSSDGTNWLKIGSDTIALGTTAYVGIAATSHHPGMRTTAEVSNVSIAGASSPAPLPLPSGQANADIGSPAIKGSTSHTSGRYTIQAAGADIWGYSDQFHYVYQPVTGDVEVLARVVSITAADRWSKAGVMIRESLAANARHAMALTSVSKGYAFQRRAETGSISEHTDGGAGTAPGWVRLVRKGSVISAYRSADGTTWTSMGTDTIAMNETVYVGIAVTSHNVSAATTAVVEGLRITESPTSTNKPPSVMLSAPANGATYTAPASVTLTAAATDPDGTIANVEFYANSTLLGRDTSAPYSFTASLPAGAYTLTAVATDNSGATAISPAVSISVGAAQSTAPRAVAFTVSADHNTLVTRYELEVYAAGATPGVATPIARSDLGKPTPSSTGEVTVDRSSFFQALAPGNYIATVRAVGSSGSARSSSVSFTR